MQGQGREASTSPDSGRNRSKNLSFKRPYITTCPPLQIVRPYYSPLVYTPESSLRGVMGVWGPHSSLSSTSCHSSSSSLASAGFGRSSFRSSALSSVILKTSPLPIWVEKKENSLKNFSPDIHWFFGSEKTKCHGRLRMRKLDQNRFYKINLAVVF